MSVQLSVLTLEWMRPAAVPAKFGAVGEAAAEAHSDEPWLARNRALPNRQGQHGDSYEQDRRNRSGSSLAGVLWLQRGAAKHRSRRLAAGSGNARKGTGRATDRRTTDRLLHGR